MPHTHTLLLYHLVNHLRFAEIIKKINDKKTISVTFIGLLILFSNGEGDDEGLKLN